MQQRCTQTKFLQKKKIHFQLQFADIIIKRKFIQQKKNLKKIIDRLTVVETLKYIYFYIYKKFIKDQACESGPS